MIEVTIKGRGFGGVMPAARMLATALALQGKFVQAFPASEFERSQAPFDAMIRFDDEMLYLRCLVKNPDHIVAMDPRLIAAPGALEGLKPTGWLVLNHPMRPHEMKLPEHMSSFRLASVDASRIETHCRAGDMSALALAATMAGAFAKVTGLVDPGRLVEALRQIDERRAERCVDCASLAFEEVCFET